MIFQDMPSEDQNTDAGDAGDVASDDAGAGDDAGTGDDSADAGDSESAM